MACAGFTCVEFRDDAGKMNGAEFLRGVVKAFPYAIRTVLTDNGMAFADLPKNRNGPTRRCRGAPIFDRGCNEHGIEHRLTKPYPPWTNDQAEQINRTVKDAITKTFHDPDLESLKAHVLAFVSAYTFAKQLKALRWRTPFKAVCHAWTTTPDILTLNPRYLIPGLNNLDLQVGGKDPIENMAPLDQSINRSLGVQLNQAIRSLPNGTRLDPFSITDLDYA